MTIRVDPERNEIYALKQVADWRGKRLIELGCGDGRLTLRLASLGPRSIRALDPGRDLVRLARQNLPEKYAGMVRYKVGSALDLKYPDGTFDLAVFSWVL